LSSGDEALSFSLLVGSKERQKSYHIAKVLFAFLSVLARRHHHSSPLNSPVLSPHSSGSKLTAPPNQTSLSCILVFRGRPPLAPRVYFVGSSASGWENAGSASLMSCLVDHD